MRHEKAELLLKLAIDLQGSALGLTIDDIRTRYTDRALGRRTAERLRDAVGRVMGDRLEQVNPGERPKRWRLRAGITSNGLITPSLAELGAVETAAALLRAQDLRMEAESLRSLAAKVRALMPREKQRKIEPDLEILTESEGIAARPGPRLKIDPVVAANLRQAILACRKVRITYRYRASGKTGFDTVHPYGFLYGARHYLIAWSENRLARSFRTFALANVTGADILDTSFRRRTSFSIRDYAERSFGVFQEKPMDIVWRFTPEAAPDAREFLFHPTQTFEDRTDGSLIVRFRAGGLREMSWHLITWGKSVEVLKPAALRRDVEEVLDASRHLTSPSRARVSHPPSGNRQRRGTISPS